MQDIGKFDVKENVLPNGLEKYMAFTINKSLVFIDSMQLMNSSLDALIKNLSVYLYEYMDSFKKVSEDKLPNKCKFFSSMQDESISEKDC